MNPLLGVREGFREILAHKFRSFLTMLGVILGVASLMAMYALTEGMAEGSRERLSKAGGVERVTIVGAPIPAYQEDIADISPGRSYLDVQALRRGSQFLAAIAPQQEHGGKIYRQGRSYNPRLLGIEPDSFIVDQHKMAQGRFITDLDVENRNRVIVIGHSVLLELFPPEERENAIGKRIRINNEPFTVVGVLDEYMTDRDRRRMESERQQELRKRMDERRGRAHNSSRRRRDPFWWKNRMALVPLSTMQQVFKSAWVENGVNMGADKTLNEINVMVADVRYFNEAIEEMRNILNSTHRGIRDYGFRTREDWFENIEAGVRAAQLTGGLIAGISLLVGGIGITNIMLASITERIREIGIRRAVGATQLDIFTQIVIESLVLAIIGGLLGIFAGLGMIEVLTLVGGEDADPPVVKANAVVISLTFAVTVGLFAGIYPAYKASRLSPIQALRYE